MNPLAMLPKPDSIQHSRMTTARFQRPSNHAVLHPIDHIGTPRVTLSDHQSNNVKSALKSTYRTLTVILLVGTKPLSAVES